MTNNPIPMKYWLVNMNPYYGPRSLDSLPSLNHRQENCPPDSHQVYHTSENFMVKVSVSTQRDSQKNVVDSDIPICLSLVFILIPITINYITAPIGITHASSSLSGTSSSAICCLGEVAHFERRGLTWFTIG